MTTYCMKPCDGQLSTASVRSLAMEILWVLSCTNWVSCVTASALHIQNRFSIAASTHANKHSSFTADPNRKFWITIKPGQRMLNHPKTATANVTFGQSLASIIKSLPLVIFEKILPQNWSHRPSHSSFQVRPIQEFRFSCRPLRLH